MPDHHLNYYSITRGKYTLGPEPAPEADPSDLADLGFGPVRNGEVVRLTTCPLIDLAVEDPDVICQVHLGLVDGTLDRGDDDVATELTPFAEPGAHSIAARRTSDTEDCQALVSTTR